MKIVAFCFAFFIVSANAFSQEKPIVESLGSDGRVLRNPPQSLPGQSYPGYQPYPAYSYPQPYAYPYQPYYPAYPVYSYPQPYAYPVYPQPYYSYPQPYAYPVYAYPRHSLFFR